MTDSSAALEWSEDERVRYIDGNAWAIKNIWDGEGLEMKTVCIGKREDVIKDYPVRGKSK